MVEETRKTVEKAYNNLRCGLELTNEKLEYTQRNVVYEIILEKNKIHRTEKELKQRKGNIQAAEFIAATIFFFPEKSKEFVSRYKRDQYRLEADLQNEMKRTRKIVDWIEIKNLVKYLEQSLTLGLKEANVFWITRLPKARKAKKIKHGDVLSIEYTREH